VNLKTARIARHRRAGDVRRWHDARCDAQASLQLDNKALVRFEQFTLHPAADGSTELKVKFQGKSVSVPVKVEKCAGEQPISFALDVMPVFTKAVATRAAATVRRAGKDGFGFRSSATIRTAIISGSRARRSRGASISRCRRRACCSRRRPAACRTPAASVQGRQRTGADTAAWLKAGAPKDGGDAARVGLEVHPRQSVLEGDGQTQQLNVRARYSDGTDRDVTR
jgi:hypothetical protein